MSETATPHIIPPSERERAIAALLALLGEKSFEEISLGEVATRADLTLAQLRSLFSSTLAILAAHAKETDRAVLEGIDPGMHEEPARERLFDVLMRRFELLAPHKAAMRSLLRSAGRHPSLALAFNAITARSQRWMLEAAEIGTGGPRGVLRAQGLAVLYANVMRTWLRDDDPGLARTMAELDRALGRGQRLSGLLDDLMCIPAAFCRARPRRRARHDPDHDPIAA